MNPQSFAYENSISAIYDQYLVPMLFQGYADDLVGRLNVPQSGAVLEVAAGTGAVTRKLRSRLPSAVKLTCSDISGEMLEVARTNLDGVEGIDFQIVDATNLPYDDATFDIVICQFGAMFFPDKQQAFAEIARVLKPEGTFIFNVWDSIERNHLMNTFQRSISTLFSDDPPRFLKTPFSYCDLNEITKDLQSSGYGDIEIAVLPRQVHASSASAVVRGQIEGSPLLAELKSRNMATKGTYSEIEQALVENFGPGAIVAPMQAITIAAQLE